MLDFKSEITVAASLAIAARSGNSTVNGATVSLSGYHGATIVITTGVITDGNHTIEIQESVDGSSWTAVADADLDGTEPVIVAANDDVIYHIGYKGYKGNIRVSVTDDTSTTGGILGANVLLGHEAQIGGSPIIS